MYTHQKTGRRNMESLNKLTTNLVRAREAGNFLAQLKIRRLINLKRRKVGLPLKYDVKEEDIRAIEVD